ncbi:PREDICTED: S1 RNA-binding domain-containing protein 1 [Dinoponera quadriceps]|uniref:S1 RNA-binding domain-containing protein 1 n=1 Tax=Dinoponera quadriceps TaxID=609295 RepID=A0A6P3YAE5_DINQU|nr:PREDICTED: S1 RNA-binding domain-containing protein 1 [Dinoponera quadriceps]
MESTMERGRNKYNELIIELSDSDDNDDKILLKSTNENHIAVENKIKRKIKTSIELMKKTSKINAQSKNVECSKKENLKISNEKKRKLEAVSFTNFDMEALQKRQKKDSNINTDIKLNPTLTRCMEWTDVDYISEINNIDRNIAENVVKLFKEDNTVPFITRYRRDMTGSMEPDKLRALKNSFDEVQIIKHRAATIIKTIDKLGKWSPEIHSVITSTKCLADLEYIYSLFKPAAKRSLADKARELGLWEISDVILQGQQIPPLASFIDKQKEGLRNEEEIEDGIVHIIADLISKNKEILERVITLRKTTAIEIQTIQYKTKEILKDKNIVDKQKYEMYFNFKITERNIKPHQILAINRAESKKILSVKIVIPKTFEQAFRKYCLSLYALTVKATELHMNLLGKSVDYAYKYLIKRLVTRRVKNEMKVRAETASIEVFAANVKQLLLASPIRGKIILGIDPGFNHGCKLAVVSECGNLLDSSVIYPHTSSKTSYEHSVNVLVKLVKKHKCTVLALGNATACRETEVFLKKVIKSKAFGSLNVTYTIVNEAGSSIYSCSPEAKSEFPNLDVNIISAISIAKRLQDPLAELIKIDPKHLGVGMYQHDLPEKQLMNALNEVITEAVSFVGVDVNTASQCLLRRVAGLTSSKAANIIEWRNKHGAFQNRAQILKVKGIGNKTFEQCAGFIRILPETALINQNTKKKPKNLQDELNLLDQTWIHPESYIIADKLVEHCQCNLNDLGTSEFIEKINLYAKASYSELAVQFDTDKATIEIIVKGLTMRNDEDIRSILNQPLFYDNMQSIDDLNIGATLNGVVRNVTHFGVFVDIGVGRNGLIHVKYLKDQTLCIGQHVAVKILSIQRDRNRISLELMKIL